MTGERRSHEHKMDRNMSRQLSNIGIDIANSISK